VVGGTSVLDALFDEFGFAHDGDVWLEIADQSPVSNNIGILSAILPIKQLPISQKLTRQRSLFAKGEGIYV
jgi:hypothetical protein